MTLTLRTLALGSAALAMAAIGPIDAANARTLQTPPLEQLGSSTKHVSVSFTNAPASRVLDWLAKQDANFVVETSSIPSNVKLTLHVTDQPLNMVEHAVAHALGGSWRRDGGIMVFTKSPASAMDFDGMSQLQFGPDFQKKLQLQFGPDFQKNLQSQFGPEFQEKMQKQFGPEFQKKLQLQFGPEFQEKMEKQFGPDFEKKLQEKMEKQFGPEFQEKLEKQFGPAFQEKIEKEFGPEFQEKLEKQFGPAFQEKIEKEFGPDFQKKLQDHEDKIELQIKAAQDAVAKSGNAEFTNQDLGKLLDSLTDTQRQTMKTQGYLSPKDLTDSQQRLLGSLKAPFEVTYVTDKGSLKIKAS